MILAKLANVIRMPIGFRGSLDLKKTIGFGFRGSSTSRDCVRVKANAKQTCFIIVSDNLRDARERAMGWIVSHGCHAFILVYTILLVCTWITLLEFTVDIQCRRLWAYSNARPMRKACAMHVDNRSRRVHGEDRQGVWTCFWTTSLHGFLVKSWL